MNNWENIIFSKGLIDANYGFHNSGWFYSSDYYFKGDALA
jgi:hypothetical protein